MANISNINGKFVVEQTTGYVGIGTTDPNFLIEAAGTNAELALNASSIYRVRSTSNDEFIITKNGVGDRLTIAGGGNVGIGETNPTSKLHVKDTPVATSGAILTLRNSQATASNTTFGGIFFNSSPGYDFSIGKANVNAASTLSFRNGNTGASLMDIDASGNVGIGTATPQKALHIEGASGASASQLLVCGPSDTIGTTAGILLRAEGGEADSALRAKGGIFFEREAANGLGKLHLCNNNSNNNDSATLADAALTIAQNKNVGIGTGTPDTILHITKAMSSSPTSNIYLDVSGTNTNGGGGSIIFSSSATAGTTTNYNAAIKGVRDSQDNGSSELQFFTTHQPTSAAAAERMRINSSGDVLINTQGKFLQGRRSTGSVVIDMIGFGAGTDNLQIKGGTSGGANAISFYDTAGFLATFYNSNFGIGIGTPQTTLQVNGASSAFNAHFGQGTDNQSGVFGGISLGYSEGGNASYRKVGIVAKAIADGAARQDLHFLVDTASDSGSAGIADSKMSIAATTGYVTINERLGVGTTNPSGDVDIAGPYLFLGTENANNGTTYLTLRNYDSTLVDQNDVPNMLRMTSRYWSGAASQLVETRITHIKDSSNGNGGSALGFMTQTGGDSPVEHMRINKVGQVGIGTSSPSTVLQVHGQQKWYTTNADGNELRGFFNPGGSGDDGEFSVYKDDGATEGVVLRGAGNTYIRIDSTSLKFINFYYGPSNVGQIVTGGSNVLYQSNSDYRLKENVVEMTGALNRVSELKPSRYNFISHPEEQVDGFMAHELQEVVPQAVSGQKDEMNEDGTPKYQGVDHSQIVPLLVGAIKELKAEIEQLKTQINN